MLTDALQGDEAELIAIYGRRRVGKTFLIRSVYMDRIAFEITGVHKARLNEQLENFSLSLQKSMGTVLPAAAPESWLKAFHYLEQWLATREKGKKWVVFMDEFPWLDSPRSGFLRAFEHFWNAWASRQQNMVIVLCGSAAAWMVENIVRNKGGLHNRLTRKMRLLPFGLAETAIYLKSRRITLDRYQLLQLYMAAGGIPQYLKEAKPGESAAQTIDRLAFTEGGILKTEFKDLFQSLFDNAQHHERIIRELAKNKQGLTRNELIKLCKLTSGGTTTRLFYELEESGFISQYLPFQKDIKDGIYKLSDEYSLFYLKFIEGSRAMGKGTWLRLSSGASYSSWSGYAFESICQKHVGQIKRALGVEGVHADVSAWRSPGSKDERGAQIDMLIDRQDHCINVCEMKFSTREFVIDKAYAADLIRKLEVMKEKTKTRKTLFLTMITTHGTKKNPYYVSLVQNEVTMDALFS